MKNKKYRIEKDSMGEMKVPHDALYGAQTQRAIENFPISNIQFNRDFINAVVLIKRSASIVNEKLGILDSNKKNAIVDACDKILQDELNSQFPIDIFQTGSGTSTNMNANEVIANLASAKLKDQIPY